MSKIKERANFLKVPGCPQFDGNDLSNNNASENKRFYRFPDAKDQNSLHYMLFPTVNKIFCEDDWIDSTSICATQPDIYRNLNQIAHTLLTINCQNAVVERGFRQTSHNIFTLYDNVYTLLHIPICHKKLSKKNE
uniref:Transposase n=1 Tax=Romanomermis culicivorax TaxID=13658 RepID=A0A915HUE0_ROMCU